MDCHRLGVGVDYKGIARDNFGVWNYSVWLCGRRYMTIYYLKKFHIFAYDGYTSNCIPQKVNFPVCRLKKNQPGYKGKGRMQSNR